MNTRIRILLASLLLVLLPPAALAAEGSLMLVSEQPDAGWIITLDNSEHDFYQGVTFYLDPGVHRLEAQAPGYRPIDRPVTIGEGEQVTVELELMQQQPLPVEPTLVEQSGEQTGRVVLVGTSPGTAFTIASQSGRTPASYILGTGDHLLSFAGVDEAVTVGRDAVLYLRLDEAEGRIDRFMVSERQAEQLERHSASLAEAFDRGYREYGPQWYTSLPAVGIYLLILLLAVLLAVLRLSVAGRVGALLRRQRSLASRHRVTTDAKKQVEIERQTRRLRRQRRELEEYLRAREKALSRRCELYAKKRTRDRKTARALQRKHRICTRKLKRTKKQISRLTGSSPSQSNSRSGS